MPKEKIVCVDWDDATYHDGYYNKSKPEDYTPTKTRTVGILIRKTTNAVIISVDRFYEDDGKPFADRHITTIPKKMIKKITELKIGG